MSDKGLRMLIKGINNGVCALQELKTYFKLWGIFSELDIKFRENEPVFCLWDELIKGINNKVCALQELKTHLKVHGIFNELDIKFRENEHVFSLGEGPFTWCLFSKMLDRIASLAGFRGNFTFISLCMGCVGTHLSMYCCPDLIKKLGSWASLGGLDATCVTPKIICSISLIRLMCFTALLSLLIMFHSWKCLKED